MKSSNRRRTNVAAVALAAAAATAAAVGVRTAAAAATYSFETLYNNTGTIDVTGTRPDNFVANGGDTTVTQDTIGATDGTHSMKFAQGPGATFTGAVTTLNADAPVATGVYGISFDLTVPAGGDFGGGFARIGMAAFGRENDSPDPQNPVIDFLQTPGFAEQNIHLQSGQTYHLTIPTIALFNPRTFDLYPSFSSCFGAAPSSLTPTSFEFYINKSVAFSYAVYIDNVQTVTTPVAVWNNDNDGNWSDASKWNGQPTSGGSTNVVPDGANTLVLLGSISASNARTITVDSPRTIGSMALNGTGTFTVGGTSTLSIATTGSNVARIDVHRGVHAISAPLQLNSDTTVNIAQNVGLLTISNFQTTARAITKVGAGQLAVNHVRAGTLTVSAGTVTVTADGTNNGTSKLGALAIAGGATPTGTLDLTDNDLIVGSATSKSTVEGYVKAARNGGAWNGTGLNSSIARDNANHTTALGVISGAEKNSSGGTGTFGGQTYAATDTLVKYTWNGDANLDGRVTFDDYVKIDTGFNTQSTGWFNGDFNYSGNVSFDDYVLIDIAFNQQNGTLSRAIDWISGDDRSHSSAAGVSMVSEHFGQFGVAYGQAFLAAVPEPAALALFVPVAISTLRRRRR